MINGKSYTHPEIILESYNCFLIVKARGLLSDILAEHIIYNILDSDEFLIECDDQNNNQIKSDKIRRVKVMHLKTQNIYYYIVDCRNSNEIKVYNIIASYKKNFLKSNLLDIKQNSLSNYLQNYNWNIVYQGSMKNILLPSKCDEPF